MVAVLLLNVNTTRWLQIARVSPLLLQMPDEEAFCLLVRLMHSYDLRGHFLPEMPKLQLRLVRFSFIADFTFNMTESSAHSSRLVTE